MKFDYNSKELAEELEKAFLSFGEVFNDTKKVYKDLQSKFSENGKSNIYSQDDKLYIEVLAAGLDKKEIKVNLVDDILEVKSDQGLKSDEVQKFTLKEFTVENLDKKFRITKNYVDGDFDISLKNGILTIEITKPEKKKQTKEFYVL